MWHCREEGRLCIFHCAPPASVFVPDVLGLFDHILTLSFQTLVGRDLKWLDLFWFGRTEALVFGRLQQGQKVH